MPLLHNVQEGVELEQGVGFAEGGVSLQSFLSPLAVAAAAEAVRVAACRCQLALVLAEFGAASNGSVGRGGEEQLAMDREIREPFEEGPGVPASWPRGFLCLTPLPLPLLSPPLQAFCMSFVKIHVPRSAGRDEHLAGQHQRSLRPHRGLHPGLRL